MHSSFYDYWGKAQRDGPAYHLLPYHCLDVAAVGSVLLSKNNALLKKIAQLTSLSEHVCKQWLLLCLSFHDIGKFSSSFQNLRPDLLERFKKPNNNKPYTIRHDSLGYLLLQTLLEKEDAFFHPDMNYDDWQDALIAIIQPFTGHHGVPPQTKGLNGLPLRSSLFFSAEDYNSASQFIQNATAIFIDPLYELDISSPSDLEKRFKKSSWLMSGFAVLCDWLGSNSDWFPLNSEIMPLRDYWEHHAIPQAKQAIRAAGIASAKPITEFLGFSHLFTYIETPTPLQTFAENCTIEKSPQLFILEDITGSGKTEAALILAGRLMEKGCGNGLYIALPSMATSNAMYDRVAEVYRKLFADKSSPSIILAHGASHLSETFMASITGQEEACSGEENASAQCSTWLADNRKKSLLADVGVGTIDQALLAVLPARFQSLRLFGLAGHVLIVDEVHAYDPYMNKLLQNLLSFQAALGGSAILLSATLPAHIRGDFIHSFARGCNDLQPLPLKSSEYPLATFYCKGSELLEAPIEATLQRRCSVKVKLVGDEKEVINQIEEAISKGQCVCWIRNTVHDALSGYEMLKSKLSQDSLMLFHARFAMGDRQDIETKVVSMFGKKSTAQERCGKVLVATQVVEQSLDLDFDLLISDLAPMDLIIQRAGRLHRHKRDTNGNPLLGGVDQRELPCMIIHSPSLEKNANGDWYKSAFPKAAYVYPSHGCLWLTAKLLSQKGSITMPDDARPLIEAAFSEAADLIPESLQQRDLQAYSKSQADKSLAHINMLKLNEGYSATVNQWREDMKTPTRLGGMGTTIRLVRWDGEQLLPWYSHDRFSWDMSQVNIRNSLLDEEIIYDGLLGDKMTELKESLPDKGKWSVLIPLQKNDDARWCGQVINQKNEILMLIYDQLTGLTVSKKEQ